MPLSHSCPRRPPAGHGAPTEEGRWLWNPRRGRGVGGVPSPRSRLPTAPPSVQEKRRAERAEQQRIRSEREKERQARLAVRDPGPAPAPRPGPRPQPPPRSLGSP